MRQARRKANKAPTKKKKIGGKTLFTSGLLASGGDNDVARDVGARLILPARIAGVVWRLTVTHSARHALPIQQPQTGDQTNKANRTRFCAVDSPTVGDGACIPGRSHPAHPQGQCTTASPRSTRHGRGHSSASCRPSDRQARHRTSFGPPCSPSGRPRWHSLWCTCRRGRDRSPPQRDGTCRSAMSSGSRSARNAVQSHRHR